MVFLEIDEPVLRRAAALEPAILRMLDALHLASTLELSPLPDSFLCHDERLTAAARWNGLAVASPGADEIHAP